MFPLKNTNLLVALSVFFSSNLSAYASSLNKQEIKQILLSAKIAKCKTTTPRKYSKKKSKNPKTYMAKSDFHSLTSQPSIFCIFWRLTLLYFFGFLFRVKSSICVIVFFVFFGIVECADFMILNPL